MRAIRVPATVVLALLAASLGCEPRGDADVPAQADPAPGWSPEAQMRATLSNLVHAQTRHFEAHGRFGDDPGFLMQQHEFTPVGETTVTITFAGTRPDRGYLATALHPDSDSACTVQHGHALDGREFAGEITCDGSP